jgi:hypothetical protein
MLEVVVPLCGVDEPELCACFLEVLDFTFGRSEMREPEADGGNFGCDAGLRSREWSDEEAM